MALSWRLSSRSLALVLLLSCMAQLGMSKSVIPGTSPRLALTGGIAQVCISPWSQMVTCDMNDPESDSVGGYQVMLFEAVIQRLGWTDDMYTYRCMNVTLMMADLQSPNGTCFIAPNGIGGTPDNYELGLKFTWPTYKESLSILVAADVVEGKTFLVFLVFHWSLWLTILATALWVGLTIWISDTFGSGLTFINAVEAKQLPVNIVQSDDADVKNASLDDSSVHAKRMVLSSSFHEMKGKGGRLQLVGLANQLWLAMGSCIGCTWPLCMTWGARIVLLVWAFLVLIMSALWSANTSALITTNHLGTNIATRADLVGKAVGTFTPFLPELAKYGIAASPFPWENNADEAAMVNALASGMISALVLDTSAVKYYADTNCTFHVVGSTFHSWYLSWGFPAVTPAADIDQFTSALVYLQMTNNTMDAYEVIYLKTVDACPAYSSAIQPVTFRQVSGLWMILGGCMAVSLISCGIVLIWRKVTGSAR